MKEAASPYTIVLAHTNPSAVLPSLGLGALFNNNQYVGLAIPLSVADGDSGLDRAGKDQLRL